MSAGVTGTMTLDQALRAILAGTGVAFRTVSASLYVLDLPSVSEVREWSRERLPATASPKHNAPLRDIPRRLK